jgi:beta-galactosidase
MEMNHQWLSNPEVFQVNRLDAISSHKFFENKEENESSYIHLLNGTWKFHYANSLNQIISGFEKNDYDCSEWDDIQVPGHIQLQGYGTPMYVNQVYPWSGKEQLLPGKIPNWNPVGSYVTNFDSSILKENTDTRIVFHGVESGMALWINGSFVGYCEDSFTPSSFDITKYIIEGNNKVAVNVYRFTSGSWLEDQDFWRFSGIFRDVELVSIPCVHINDLKIIQDTTDLDNPIVSVYTEIIGSDYQMTMKLLDPNENLLETKESNHHNMFFTINDPMLWSAEKPYLYQLEIELKKDNQVVEYVKEKIGIRRFELKDGIMYLNQKRIVFHGVDRHEFCCESGRVVSYDLTKQDIINMKKNNINAIRTSHYPNQTFLYDLCDEYGIYVIDEVNMETHGTWSEMYDPEHIIPSDKPEWKENLIDRATSMYERDKNHACILIWSCGNESYGGKDIYEMSEYLRKQDPSRLVHYEGVHVDPRYPDTTDMYSRMYTPVSEIEPFLKEHTNKPFILCEYSHAMGNSNGALYKYTNLEKKYDNYQGGFIWDYVDQALLNDGKLYYGGDYRERPSDYDFCGNGIMFADRTPTPKLQEVKYCYQFIDTTINENNISIQNNYLFTNLNEFDVELSLYKNGYLLDTREMNLDCEPGKSITIENPFYIDNTGEFSVLIFFKKDNQEYAHEQYVYSYVPEEKHSNQEITINEDYLNIGVAGKNFNVIFSKQKGLVSYKVNSYEFIRQPLRPNFFRASTNNDVENGYGFRYGQWLINSLYANCKYKSCNKSDYQLTIYYDYELPSYPNNLLHIKYEVYGDGEIVIDMKLDSLGNHIEMPEFGILLQTYQELDTVNYYGNGPEENYVDRNKGSVLGRYKYDVDDNLTTYLYPQECGNRTDTRECFIASKNHSLTITGKPYEFSVLRYTPSELENAKHQWELPKKYQTVISINEKQMGVAGDNTWGARTHEEFVLDKKEHFLKVSIKGK